MKPRVKETGAKGKESPYAMKTNKPASVVNLKDAGLPTTISLIKRTIKLNNPGCR